MPVVPAARIGHVFVEAAMEMHLLVPVPSLCANKHIPLATVAFQKTPFFFGMAWPLLACVAMVPSSEVSMVLAGCFAVLDTTAESYFVRVPADESVSCSCKHTTVVPSQKSELL